MHDLMPALPEGVRDESAALAGGTLGRLGTIRAWSAVAARGGFLERFRELGGR